MQDASETSAAPQTASVSSQPIAVRVQKEMHTRRFVLGGLVALAWLVLLLMMSGREGHGLFESAHTEFYSPFQLPGPEAVSLPVPGSMAGTLERKAGFGGFNASPDKRDWFELRLPATGSAAVAPEAVVAVENVRLFNQDGSLRCTLDMRLDASLRPSRVGVGADLALSQQPVEYPVREVAAHRFEVFWRPAYGAGCAYEEPAWVVADVVRKQTVAAEQSLWLELAHEERVIRAGDSSITSRPGELPGEWLIEVVNLGEQSLHFVPADYPAHRGWHRVRYAHSGRYDGLWDRLVRSEAFLVADLYRLRFEGAPPERLPVRLLRGKEERLADVRFSTDAELRSAASVPSTWHIALAHTGLDLPQELPAQRPGEEYHELFLPLPLSAVCQLRVVDSGLPALRWRSMGRLPVDKYRRYTQLPDSHLDRTRWELQSPDGEQRFFHDIQVESELSCPVVMAWQALPYPASETPWLVAANALPAGAVELQQPAQTLFGRFRFLDATGQALMPVSRSADMADPLLENFLFPGDVFKFHGEVVRIEQLTTLDATPRTVRWVYPFMKLEAR
ncbi:MAG: hypothetical protein ACN6O6_13835 [Pseudomonas sp.]|uniref:hypothetical protein n=1 Tax=Pseudomonas sp. TaxID=306 RepID=UPI003D0FADFF